jgi:hypothetical protein
VWNRRSPRTALRCRQSGALTGHSFGVSEKGKRRELVCRLARYARDGADHRLNDCQRRASCISQTLRILRRFSAAVTDRERADPHSGTHSAVEQSL